MDIMLILQLIVLFGAIFIGARLGSIAIGFAGGLGVLVLALFLQMPTKQSFIPIDVILIIMSVIAAIAAMQLAGGLDYMVHIAERILRKNPQQINYLAPIVTYLLTFMAGTGHTAYSMLPVITEVAKEQGVRPSRPLSIAVVSSQIAITASPISAAVVAISGLLEPQGVGYLQILAICIPSSFIACMITAFCCRSLGKELKDDPIYQERLAQGLSKLRGASSFELQPHAKLSVGIFLFAVVAVVIYATLISDTVGIIKNPTLGRNEAIMVFMLAAATAIVFFAHLDAGKVLNMSTFKSGMSACVCVLGVAWLGTTFVEGYKSDIQLLSGNLLQEYPWLLAVIFFFASTLLYSQASTTKVLVPLAITLAVSPATIVASFAAVSALFVLPTYPTLIAAVEMDDTGSTRIGKFVFNHPFLIPGVLAIALSVALAFPLAKIIL